MKKLNLKKKKVITLYDLIIMNLKTLYCTTSNDNILVKYVFSLQFYFGAVKNIPYSLFVSLLMLYINSICSDGRIDRYLTVYRLYYVLGALNISRS